MDKYFLLDEKSRRLLQQLIEREKRRGSQPQLKQDSERSFDAGDGAQAPEVYAALIPVGGLDAMTGVTPGKAECTIYQLNRDTEELEESTRAEQMVYNVGNTLIPAGTYVVVKRDKFGTWFIDYNTVDEDGTGSGTGTGSSFDYSLTVEETDGSPSVTDVNKIQFRSMFFSVTNPGVNIARVDYPTGVIEFSGTTLTLTDAHFGKVLVYTGSTTTTISGIGAVSTGFKCAVYNAGGSVDALIRWDRGGSTGYDYIPRYHGYDAYKPGIGDTATLARAMSGLTQFSVRKESGTYTLTRADQSRLIVFTATGNFNLFVPDSDDAQFACAVSALGGNVNIVRATGRELDGAEENVVLEEGCGSVWLFTDGTDWFTVRGRVCEADQPGTGTGTGTDDECGEVSVVTDVTGSINTETCEVTLTLTRETIRYRRCPN